MNNIRANLWKIYVYKLLSDFYLIVPIIIPFYKSNRLSTTEIFIVQSAYCLGVLLLEIPSGYFSDVMGRKKTLVLGVFFLPIGLGIYAISTHFFGFILAELILSIANSMRSGTDSALIYDTLLQLKEESLYEKFVGKADFFARIGSSIFQLWAGLGAKNSYTLSKKIGKKNPVFVLLIISIVFMVLGMIQSIFLIGFVWNLSVPLLLGYLNRIIESDVRATVLSVNNMAAYSSFIVLSPLFGTLVDVYSLSAAYIVMAIYFFVIGSLSVFLLIKNKVL